MPKNLYNEKAVMTFQLRKNISDQTNCPSILSLILLSYIPIAGCSSKNNFHGQNKFKSISIEAMANREVMEPWASTPEELSVVLHAGMDDSQQPCASDPLKYDKVATKLVPINYCLTGNALELSQTREFCLLSNSGDFRPARDDNCWQSESQFQKLALLANGANELKLFVRDDRGNEAADGDGIILHMGNPPLIDFLSPSPVDAAEKKWTTANIASQPLHVRFKVTDNDTEANDLKIIVRLADPSDLTRTVSLGCNFVNSPKWQQCPLDTDVADSRIQLNSATSEFAMQFQIPESWDLSKPFIVLVTAIDQSGNASIASTPELNAGWEVIAGRTYKGIGGSGITVQNDPSIKRRIIADRNGVIYLPSERLKIDPFDVRTCRMFRTPAEPPTFQDCRDIIVSTWQPHGDNWAYDRTDDAFYSKASQSTSGRRLGLVKINFKAKTIVELTSATGKDNLPRRDLLEPETLRRTSVPKQISDYQADVFIDSMTWSAYDDGLILKVNSMLVVMNRNGELRFLSGHDQSIEQPDEIEDALSHEIILPSGSYRISASDDGRYFIGSQKFTNREGSAYGGQYIAERFDTADGEKWRLIRLSDNPSISNDPENYYLNGIVFDPDSKSFYASIAWTAIAKMNLPAKGADKSAWSWQRLLRRGSEPSISDFLLNDEAATASISLVDRIVDFQSHDVAIAGPGLIYASDSQIGFTFAIDLKTGRTSRVTGFAVGTEPNQLALNRRLDTPRRIAGIFDKKLYFGDYFGIHRVNLDVPPENRMIELFLRRDTAPFVIDPTNRKIIRQSSANELELASIDDPAAAIKVQSAPSEGLPLNYLLQGTLQFLEHSLFQYLWRSNWDGYTVMKSTHVAALLPPVSHSAWDGRNISTATSWKLLSHPDRLRLGYDGLSKEDCSQTGCPQGNIDNTGKIIAANYRGADRRGQLGWRSPVGSPVFISPSIIFGCQTTDSTSHTSFSLTDTKGIDNQLSEAIIRFFNITHNGQLLDCSDVHTQFVSFGSKVFFNTTGGIYEIAVSELMNAVNDPSNMRPTILATRTPIADGWHLPGQPERYFGIHVDQSHIYFSDTGTDRVIRVLRRDP